MLESDLQGTCRSFLGHPEFLRLFIIQLQSNRALVSFGVMSGFQLCSNGEFLPQDLACPPPFAPYPYLNPFPPDPPSNPVSSGNGGFSLSSGAVAGLVVMLTFVFVIVFLFVLKIALKSAARRRGARNSDEDAGILLGGARAATSSRNGLEELLIKMLPVCQFRQESLLKSKECAVCLTSFEEEELIRILPRCEHTFHLPCIDKWFESHANCPLCREKITIQSIQTPEVSTQVPESVVVSIPDALEESNVPVPREREQLVGGTTTNESEEGQRNEQRPRKHMELEQVRRSGCSSSMNGCSRHGTAGNWKQLREYWGNSMAASTPLRRSFSTGSLKWDADQREEPWHNDCNIAASMILKLRRSPIDSVCSR